MAGAGRKAEARASVLVLLPRIEIAGAIRRLQCPHSPHSPSPGDATAAALGALPKSRIDRRQ